MEAEALSHTHGPIDITDILAIVILVLASMRRLSVKMAEPSEYSHLPPEVFAAWRQQALSGYSLAVQASFLKVALNTIWYYGARSLVPLPVLATGGALFFIGWIVALVVAWRRSTAARIRQAELGIVLGARADRPAGPRNAR